MMKRGHDVESAPSIWRWRTAVEHYAGIDVSLELSSVSFVDGRGKHAKSIGSQEIRALLVARKQLLGRLLDVELSIRGMLRGFGLKVGQVTRKTFEARILELVIG